MLLQSDITKNNDFTSQIVLRGTSNQENSITFAPNSNRNNNWTFGTGLGGQASGTYFSLYKWDAGNVCYWTNNSMTIKSNLAIYSGTTGTIDNIPHLFIPTMPGVYYGYGNKTASPGRTWLPVLYSTPLLNPNDTNPAPIFSINPGFGITVYNDDYKGSISYPSSPSFTELGTKYTGETAGFNFQIPYKPITWVATSTQISSIRIFYYNNDFSTTIDKNYIIELFDSNTS